MRFTFALLAFTGALATVSAVSTGSGLMKRQFPSTFNMLPFVICRSQLTALPLDCAEPCLADADTGDCNSADDTCLCNDSAFVNSVTSCIASSCTGSDLATADSDASQLCAAVVSVLFACPTHFILNISTRV